MPDLINSSNRKARKEHQCGYCLSKINKGEIYRDDTLTYEGEIYQWKSHLDCWKVLNYIPYDKEVDCGITQEVFTDALDQWMYDNNIDDEIIDGLKNEKNKVDFILNKMLTK